MKIYLAWGNLGNLEKYIEFLDYKYYLMSFEWIRNRSKKISERFKWFVDEVERLKKKYGIEVVIDSGGYTFGLNMEKYPKGYLEDYAEFMNEVDGVVEACFNADYMWDYKVSLENLKWFESQGLNPVPVYHVGHAKEVLDYYVGSYDYIALGWINLNVERQRLCVRHSWVYERYKTDDGVKLARYIKEDFLEPNGVKFHAFGIGSAARIVYLHPYTADVETVKGGYYGSVMSSVANVKDIIGDKLAWSHRSKESKADLMYLRDLTLSDLVILYGLYGGKVKHVLGVHEDDVEMGRLPSLMWSKQMKILMEMEKDPVVWSEAQRLAEMVIDGCGGKSHEYFRGFLRRFLEQYSHHLSEEVIWNTPDRAARAWRTLLSGYEVDIGALLDKRFFIKSKEEIEVEVPYVSICEHHLLPFFGVVRIKVKPREYVLGLSKYGRIVDAFARRLQIQERLTKQIYDALNEALNPEGLIVEVEGIHLCSRERGFRKRMKFVTVKRGGVYEREKE